MNQAKLEKCPACGKMVERLIEAWTAMYLCRDCWPNKSLCGKKPKGK